MKCKVVRTVLVLVVMRSGVALKAWGQSNLLSNPSFEVNELEYWNPNNFTTGGLFPDPGVAHDGSYYATCSIGGVGSGQIYQNVSVTPGQSHTLSTWVYLGGADWGDPPSITVELRWFDGTYSGGGSTLLDSLSWSSGSPMTGWVQLRGDVVPISGTVGFILEISMTGWAAGGHADDCYLIPESCPTPANAFSRNTGFEDLNNRAQEISTPRNYRAWTYIDGFPANWLESDTAYAGSIHWGWAQDGSIISEPAHGYRHTIDAWPCDFTVRLRWRGEARPGGDPPDIGSDDNARSRWAVYACTKSDCAIGTILQTWTSDELVGNRAWGDYRLCGTFPAGTELALIEIRAWKTENTGFHVNLFDEVELDCPEGPPFTRVISPAYEEPLGAPGGVVSFSGTVTARTYSVRTSPAGTEIRIERDDGYWWNGSTWVSSEEAWVCASTQPGAGGGSWGHSIPASAFDIARDYEVAARSYDTGGNTECYFDIIPFTVDPLGVDDWDEYLDGQ